MMKFYCNRCIKEISGLERSHITIEHASGKYKYEYQRYNVADYCPDCTEKLLEILKEWGNMRNETGD